MLELLRLLPEDVLQLKLQALGELTLELARPLSQEDWRSFDKHAAWINSFILGGMPRRLQDILVQRASSTSLFPHLHDLEVRETGEPAIRWITLQKFLSPSLEVLVCDTIPSGMEWTHIAARCPNLRVITLNDWMTNPGRNPIGGDQSSVPWFTPSPCVQELHRFSHLATVKIDRQIGWSLEGQDFLFALGRCKALENLILCLCGDMQLPGQSAPCALPDDSFYALRTLECGTRHLAPFVVAESILACGLARPLASLTLRADSYQRSDMLRILKVARTSCVPGVLATFNLTGNIVPFHADNLPMAELKDLLQLSGFHALRQLQIVGCSLDISYNDWKALRPFWPLLTQLVFDVDGEPQLPLSVIAEVWQGRPYLETVYLPLTGVPTAEEKQWSPQEPFTVPCSLRKVYIGDAKIQRAHETGRFLSRAVPALERILYNSGRRTLLDPWRNSVWGDVNRYMSVGFDWM